MEGFEGALDAVLDHVEANIRPKLTELRSRLGEQGPLTHRVLPDPQLFTTENRAQIPLSKYPAIMAIGRARGGFKDIDRTRRGIIYAVRYRLRLYTWVRSRGFAAATLVRNRYSLALSELLLEKPSLSTGNGYVMPETFDERPAESVRDKQGRSIAATFLEFDVTIEELVGRPVAHEPPLTAEIEVQPAHPALDD